MGDVVVGVAASPSLSIPLADPAQLVAASEIDKATMIRTTVLLSSIDDRVASMLERRMAELRSNASASGVPVAADPYLFACDVQGVDPWDPDTISQYFARLRQQIDLEHLQFKGLRRFMDTYGQELGFSLAQVSTRAGFGVFCEFSDSDRRPGRVANLHFPCSGLEPERRIELLTYSLRRC